MITHSGGTGASQEFIELSLKSAGGSTDIVKHYPQPGYGGDGWNGRSYPKNLYIGYAHIFIEHIKLALIHCKHWKLFNKRIFNK